MSAARPPIQKAEIPHEDESGQARHLTLLVELPAWPRVFFRNLRDLILPPRLPALDLRTAPALFWPDVFVRRALPWSAFLQSGVCHGFAFIALVVLTRFLALLPYVAATPSFDRTQVVYYTPAEYLPPLDTRESDPAPHRRPTLSSLAS